MNIEFREAKLEDAALLVEIKDASFYSDFVKCGECPGYGNTVEMMEKITLVTPADKEENVKFYTEKCGFDIEDTEQDGSVILYRFLNCRNM